MKHYPETATERFDDANFHINYCLSFIKKYIKGNILEIGAGCGSFTKNYYKSKFKNIVLTEKDEKNIFDLQKKFKKNSNIKISNLSVENINDKFDTILYLHVLEHIKDDLQEIENAKKKLNEGGYLVIMVPAHQKIFGNLDKAVGHFRRYEKSFFKTNLLQLKLINLKYLDSMGYLLYYLNKIFFKNETFPSKLKIFLWDKIFTPISLIIDFLTNYRYGKCIIAVYKRN
jgi:2-polyprenyl-3-methyl-5-hydroxy-6-metoxy-1,4-benzoquinol methylase